MNWQRLTKRILVGTVLAGIVLDIFLAIFGGVDATISRVTIAASDRWPILVVFIGILIGHLWWARDKIADRSRKIVENVPVAGIAIGAVLGHLFWPDDPVRSWVLSLGSSVMLLALVVGIVIGHFFWGQPKPPRKR